MQIKNKVTVITGASSGIGLATATLFAEIRLKRLVAHGKRRTQERQNNHQSCPSVYHGHELFQKLGPFDRRSANWTGIRRS